MRRRARLMEPAGASSLLQRERRRLFHARSWLSGRILTASPPRSVFPPLPSPIHTHSFKIQPNHVSLACCESRLARSKPGRTQKYALGPATPQNLGGEKPPLCTRSVLRQYLTFKTSLITKSALVHASAVGTHAAAFSFSTRVSTYAILNTCST